MQTGKSFAAYRYFLVPSEQISIFDKVGEERAVAVKQFFARIESDKKISFEVDSRKHIFVFERKIDKHTLVLKFAIEKHETKYRESETGIESVIEPNLPFVYLIFDIKRQLLLIEINTSVFAKIAQAKQKVQKCFEQQFMMYGFEVILEEIIDENTFWSYVEKSNSIHDVTITLNSPNLFSGFLEIGKMLKGIRELYNNTQTTLKVTNKNGPLTGITKENPELVSAVRYSSGGGGEWSLTVKTGGVKRTFRSRNNIKKVNLIPVDEMQVEGSSREINGEIIKALNTVETILTERNGNETNH